MPETLSQNGEHKLKLDKIYELTFKVGPALKTLRFEAESDLDAQEKGTKYVKFVDGLSTSKAILIGHPKKFAVNIEDEIIRIKKLVDSGRSPFF